MKTKEFIKSVEALGFQTHVSGKKIKVCDEMRGYGVDDPMFILTSDLSEVYVPNEFYISSLERRGVLKLIVEYLDTPNSEREEEKKYHLKLELPIPLKDSSMQWLNQKVGASKYHFGSQENIRDYKTIFTESEVAQMDLTGLKLIEVKDE